MKRRGFLAGILAAGFAPAAVGSGVLMPVRKVVTPPSAHDFIASLLERDKEVLAYLERNNEILADLPFVEVRPGPYVYRGRR